MTDQKISDLTAAGVVNDADVFPLVQSGDTKQATIALMKAAVAPGAASESAAGIIEIANQAEAESGSNDDKAMTSLKTQQWADVGIVLDGATGGAQGAGTINAKGIFVDGEAVDSGGNWELITTLTPTGVANCEITGIPQTYKSLYLEINNISCNTATRYLVIQPYGASTSFGSNGFSVISSTISAISNFLWGTIVPTMSAAQDVSGYVHIPFYQALTDSPVSYNRAYDASYYINGVTATPATIQGQIFTTTGGFDNSIVKFYFAWNSSGNFDGGTIKLYGSK